MMGLVDIACDAACRAARGAVDGVYMGELRTMGDVDQYIASAMSSFFKSYGPQMASQLMAIAGPAAAKAGEIIGPTVEQKLKEYGPTFALMTGAVVGLAILVGVWISRKTFQRTRSQ